MVVLFTLKNPSFPEFIYQTESGVMSVHIHPQHPSMIAVGLYDGGVLVYNIQVCFFHYPFHRHTSLNYSFYLLWLLVGKDRPACFQKQQQEWRQT